ncbi:MAG: transposase, partial [Nitrosomonas sp.]|nr:transposase [Nitrosomonas sp.]MDP1951060.1 transposase [Nitrosomonas sp.]
RDERQRLDAALKLNKPLATAYYMKEELRDIWLQPDKNSAETALDEWVGRSRYRGEMLPINLIQGHNSSSPRKGFFVL